VEKWRTFHEPFQDKVALWSGKLLTLQSFTQIFHIKAQPCPFHHHSN
jgi:hypothetical protein